MVPESNIRCTRYASSEGISGCTYSGDIRRLASIVSGSVLVPDDTAYGGCTIVVSSPGCGPASCPLKVLSVERNGRGKCSSTLPILLDFRSSMASLEKVSDLEMMGMTFVTLERRLMASQSAEIVSEMG